ncbi:MAG TPA: PIG-L family deacetylase [Candidatus Pacearchaeota archaeon]|nr:PIG-L family deacetylase [Candidatus Pacearchaeota archaeon]
MKTLIVFSAHPDDMEFGCSGTVCKLIKQGYEAILVVATNGESGFKQAHKSRSQRVKIREEEQKKAAEIIGFKKVLFLHEKDGHLENSFSFRKKLVSLIKKHKPNFIFTFDPANRDFSSLNLSHKDHRAIGEAVFDSAFAAKNKFLFPGEPHKVDKLFFFGSNNQNHQEDITEFLEIKIEALKQHKSQFPDFDKVEKFVKKYLLDKSEKGYFEKFRVVEVLQIT